MHTSRFYATRPDWLGEIATGLIMAAIISTALFGGLYLAA